MGPKSKAKSPRPPTQEIGEDVLTKVTALKNEGNKCFAKRDYESALEQYETAAQLLPEAAPERVDLICNRAACYYQMKRFKDAAKECTSALELNPSSAKALQRRARSLEQQGLYKQALADIQAVNRWV
ncbi:import receptor subunit TOM70 [Monoraphidium neglectum]|uniref:Import receptor subunit TOM70 n=1 Tax=Monoraphidium neglectum TaxID=145388 RepID=A0A0D2M0I1_9CHLO|nr:import receptor subunit TOM70 [Monoraphidium neglectum]KIY95021.1 import receptor subunit TOM70 [Monoraphidium neglectum]|eukprot:XP_013894041.1 import receptor subunit TOM70 [Monoraphidium neglectum]